MLLRILAFEYPQFMVTTMFSVSYDLPSFGIREVFLLDGNF